MDTFMFFLKAWTLVMTVRFSIWTQSTNITNKKLCVSAAGWFLPPYIRDLSVLTLSLPLFTSQLQSPQFVSGWVPLLQVLPCLSLPSFLYYIIYIICIIYYIISNKGVKCSEMMIEIKIPLSLVQKCRYDSTCIQSALDPSIWDRLNFGFHHLQRIHSAV